MSNRIQLSFLAFVFGLAGCGEQTGQITGKVYFRGKPLSSGSVTFVAENGHTRSSAIGKDGFYKILKMPLGKATISVFSHPPIPAAIEFPDGKGSGTARPERGHVVIPKRYEDEEKSGLFFTVKGGTQSFDIDLPDSR